MPRRLPSPSSPTLAMKSKGKAVAIASLMKGGSQGPESGQSGAVVTDSGTEEPRVLAANVERSGGGKNGIQMSADGDDGSLGMDAGGQTCRQVWSGGGWGRQMDLGPQRQKVSDGVRGGREAEGLETLGEPGGAGLLGKRRRGNGGDGELKVGDVALVAGEPLEQTMDARVGSEATDLLRRAYRAERARTSDRLQGTKRHQK